MKLQDVDAIDRELVLLRERMNRLFDESIASMRAGGTATWTPAADVYRVEDRIVVTLELPGIDERSLQIEANGTKLRVRGRRQVVAGGRGVLQLERGYGTFEREFALPEAARLADKQLAYEEGVLRIEIPIGEP